MVTQRSDILADRCEVAVEARHFPIIEWSLLRRQVDCFRGRLSWWVIRGVFAGEPTILKVHLDWARWLEAGLLDHVLSNSSHEARLQQGPVQGAELIRRHGRSPRYHHGFWRAHNNWLRQESFRQISSWRRLSGTELHGELFRVLSKQICEGMPKEDKTERNRGRAKPNSTESWRFVDQVDIDWRFFLWRGGGARWQ